MTKAISIKTPGTPKASGKQYGEPKHETRPRRRGVSCKRIIVNKLGKKKSNHDSKEGSGIDGEIKEGEELGPLGMLILIELIGGERRNTRFYAASCQCDNNQATEVEGRLN